MISLWNRFKRMLGLPYKIVLPPMTTSEISEMMHLRAHIDECITDPDYFVSVNYECNWDEDMA